MLSGRSRNTLMCDKTGRKRNISEMTVGELSGPPLSWSPLMTWLVYGDPGSQDEGESRMGGQGCEFRRQKHGLDADETGS